MYCINESYQEDFYQSNIYRFYFGDLKIGVIDIETTGLSPDRSQCILGGIVLPQESGKNVYQFLAENREEEREVLRTYLQEWQDLDVVVSYNGDHFDLPFLSRRARYHRIPREELPVFLSIDLYSILDKHSPFRKMLPNLKQKTVENFLGLWSDRADEISGGESVEMYYRYARTGDPHLRDIILLHNRDDLLQLSRLIKVFDKLDLHRIAFHTGFAVTSGEKKAYIRKLAFQKDIFTISGVHKNTSLDYRSYHESHEAFFSSKQKDFTVRVPMKNLNGYHCVDLEEFPYQLGDLEKYPGYQSGYLLMGKKDEVNYGETNHLAKLILSEILKEV